MKILSIFKSKSSNNIVVILLGVLGAVLFSSKAILVKLTYRIEPIDATTMLTLRLLFALPFYLFSIARQSRNAASAIAQKDWFWLVFMGLIGFYVSAWLDFAGLKYVPAAIERLILFIYPSIVLLVTALVFKQKINRYQYIALLLTYFGIALAVGEEALRNSAHHTPLSNSDFWKGALLVFGCALTYSLYMLIGGRIIQRIGAIRVTNWAMVFATLGIIVHFLLYYEIKDLLRFSRQLYLTILIMSFLATVLPSYLLSWSIRHIGSDNAAIINCVGPISTILQAFLFLGEPITIIQLLGTIFVLWGVLLIGSKNK